MSIRTNYTRDMLTQRHGELVTNSFTAGLGPDDAVELEFIRAQLDIIEAYDQVTFWKKKAEDTQAVLQDLLNEHNSPTEIVLTEGLCICKVLAAAIQRTVGEVDVHFKECPMWTLPGAVTQE